MVRVGNGSVTMSALMRILQPEEFREAEEKRRAAEMLERAQRAARDRSTSTGARPSASTGSRGCW